MEKMKLTENQRKNPAPPGGLEPAGRAQIDRERFATMPRRTESPGERSGEPTSPTATLSYYPLPPGTSAASLAAAAGDRMSYEWHLRVGRFD